MMHSLFIFFVFLLLVFFFFFNDTATTEIYTLSLHDALPISPQEPFRNQESRRARDRTPHLSKQARAAHDRWRWRRPCRRRAQPAALHGPPAPPAADSS